MDIVLEPIVPLCVTPKRVLRSSPEAPPPYHGLPERPERKIRPLPPVPSPASSPTSTNSSPRSVRPLPIPPPLIPPVSISITPSTPLPRRHDEQPVMSLRVNTSAETMLNPPSNRSSIASFSSSLLTPEAPTPTTARRRRMSKLCRHLGEPVPSELVTADDSTVTAALLKTRMVAKLYDMRDDSIFAHKAAAAAKQKVWDFEDESDEEYETASEATEDFEEDYTYCMDDPTPFRASGASRRYSKRWLREKGNKRWEEGNYDDILQALRSL